MRCRDLEGVARFSDRADAYARARPAYPEAAIDFITREVDGSLPVVDVAAGTAIGTDSVVRSGRRCIGIDPNLVMLACAAPMERRPLTAGKAESLPLRAGVTGLLTVFNAFHWFQPEPFFAEAHRVLVAGGRLALVWNDWNLADPFTAAFVRLMRSRAGDFPPEDREAEVAPLYETPSFHSIERREFPNIHTLDLVHLKLRTQSVSYIPKEGDAWSALEREIEGLFESFSGGQSMVRHVYRTTAFTAVRT